MKLDKHFLQDLFDCPVPTKAIGMACLMAEELIDQLLESRLVDFAHLRASLNPTLAQKLDLAYAAGFMESDLLAPLKHLDQLDRDHVSEIGEESCRTLSIELDGELAKHAYHRRAQPATRASVALCYLLMRLAENCDMRVEQWEP
jgi:hypothetical protein